jgi:hypothetical protein
MFYKYLLNSFSVPLTQSGCDKSHVARSLFSRSLCSDWKDKAQLDIELWSELSHADHTYNKRYMCYLLLHNKVPQIQELKTTCMPGMVVPRYWEVDIGRIEVQSQPRQKVNEISLIYNPS